MFKKFKALFIILIVCLLSLLCSTIWYFSTDFKKPDFDNTATKGIPFVRETYKYDSLNVYDGFNIKIATNLIAKDNYAFIYFTSPKDNTVNLKFRIYDSSDKIIAESGLIKPGYYIEKIKLKRYVSNSENVKIKVMSYEKDTYYSAGAVNLNVTLTAN